MKMKTFSMTDIGRKREINQDYVFATDETIGNLPNLLVVADGMGGHRAGDFASRFTVEVLAEEVQNSKETHPEQILGNAIQTANERLMEEAAKDSRLEGMGTTLVAATILDHVLYFANVGDSRLYLINKEIRQLSKDHSMVEEMVRLGGLTEEEAKHHPDKNIITRAMGVKDKVEPDFFEYRLKGGDTILMCSDGLTNMVDDDEIFQIVKSARDIVEAVETLIQRANENGGSDNIGIVLAQPYADEVSIW
jgi:protein phosphatase